ncbi:MAG: Wzz/FepE/Etk N-terminal domain-containing protein [Paludibacteraceae bacterium]|nr:Wzz/FepE/Etk N-terminal domain-containing protein [Paludibacteraceae bacterium]
MSEIDEFFINMMEEDRKKPSMSLPEIVVLLKFYWRYLWKKKIIVIVASVFFAILGLVYACVRTVEYTATYEFSIEGDNAPMRFSMSALLGTGTVGAFSGDNLVQLMRSPAMVERTLLKVVPNRSDSINFIEYFLVCDSVRSACENAESTENTGKISICDIQFPLSQKRETYAREQDSVLMKVASALSKSIRVERLDKKMSLVTCSFSNKDEAFSKQFLDAYIEEVISFYMETKLSRSTRNIDNFQKQADSIRSEWNRAVASRAYYADENLNVVRQSVGVELQKKQMDIQAYTTAYMEMVKSIATMKIDQMKETPIIQIINQPHYPLANNKARKLKFIIIGGFLGGFFSVLALLAKCYYENNIKPQLTNLPAQKED